MAAGQPFLYNSPAQVTTNWFPEKERPMATMVGTQMNILGIFVGFLLPGLFVDEYSEDVVLDEENRATYRSQMFKMLMFVSLISSVICVAVLTTFRDRPGAKICGSTS